MTKVLSLLSNENCFAGHSRGPRGPRFEHHCPIVCELPFSSCWCHWQVGSSLELVVATISTKISILNSVITSLFYNFVFMIQTSCKLLNYICFFVECWAFAWHCQTIKQLIAISQAHRVSPGSNKKVVNWWVKLQHKNRFSKTIIKIEIFQLPFMIV